MDKNEKKEMVEAIKSIGDSIGFGLKWLGTGDACTPMGAIESHSVITAEKIDRLSDNISDAARALDNIAASIEEHGKSIDRVAKSLETIAKAIWQK